jgi:hypothetical protein
LISTGDGRILPETATTAEALRLKESELASRAALRRNFEDLAVMRAYLAAIETSANIA